MRVLFFSLFLTALFASPEQQIIEVEHFISSDAAKLLMQHYDARKTNLNTSSDNELSMSSISDPIIRGVLLQIANRVLALMNQSYPIGGKSYHVDHGGLYSRIVGNYCPYHADNIYYECPIHGKNQQTLRTTCNANCNGRYVANHTHWREYTALIYLNDDFEGGEIQFEDGPFHKIYRKTIPIRSGLLILAPNGKDFFHEVFPIRKGKRYSLHLWFTSDSQHTFHW